MMKFVGKNKIPHFNRYYFDAETLFSLHFCDRCTI